MKKRSCDQPNVSGFLLPCPPNRPYDQPNQHVYERKTWRDYYYCICIKFNFITPSSSSSSSSSFTSSIAAEHASSPYTKKLPSPNPSPSPHSSSSSHHPCPARVLPPSFPLPQRNHLLTKPFSLPSYHSSSTNRLRPLFSCLLLQHTSFCYRFLLKQVLCFFSFWNPNSFSPLESVTDPKFAPTPLEEFFLNP